MTRPTLLVYAVASPYAWDVVESAHRLDAVAICVDNIGGADPRLPALLGPDDELPTGFGYVLGLSSAEHRALAARAAFRAGLTDPTTLIDPSAVVASTASVAHGSYLNAGVVVASNTRIGCFANVNRSASVGHDNELRFAASIGPGAVLTGDITIGPVAFVGAGATVLPGLSIGRRAIVGAGAVVTKDVADGEIVVGNPARVIRRLDVDTEEDVCPHCSAS